MARHGGRWGGGADGVVTPAAGTRGGASSVPLLRDRYGFEVGVLVRDHAYLQAVIDACPFPAADLEPKQLHVIYLARTVTPADLSGLDPAAFHPEGFRPGDRAVYLHTPDGLGRSRLADPLTRAIPNAAGPATSRNWNTVVKLAELTAGE